MNKHSRTSLFLMEIIVSVFLFCITATVCAKLFVESHVSSQKAAECRFFAQESDSILATLRTAAYCDVSDLAKVFLSYNPYGILTDTDAVRCPDIDQKTMLFLQFYDSDLTPCEKENGKYRISLTLSEENGLYRCNYYLDCPEHPMDAVANSSEESPFQSMLFQIYRGPARISEQ